jgi:hypothetical protein
MKTKLWALAHRLRHFAPLVLGLMFLVDPSDCGGS